MAALVGFDKFTTTVAVATPFIAGQTLLTLALPSRSVVAALDLTASDLDAGAVPTITLDVGDAADADRFIAATTIAQNGGLLEYRPLGSGWWRYGAADNLLVRGNTGASVDAAGEITLTAYTYPGADVSYVVKLTLQGLGVLAEGETPRAEDAAIALEALAEVHETLRGKQLANRQDLAWPLALLPMFATRPYAAMAGNLLADTFGVSAQRAARMAQRAAEAEREMRRQTYVKYDGQPINLEPYREVEAETIAATVIVSPGPVVPPILTPMTGVVEVAAFGDSYVDGAGGVNLKHHDYRGPHHWTNIALGSLLRFRTSHQIGFTGYTIPQLTAEVGQITALTPKPTLCFLSSLGHNDAVAGLPLPVSEQSARIIVNDLRTAGIIPVCSSVLPKDTADAAQISRVLALNAMWQRMADEDLLIYLDTFASLTDAGTKLPLPGVLFDATHPAAKGAKIAGDAVAAFLSPFFSGDPGVPTALDPGVLSNTINAGSAAIATAGFTGTVATGLSGYESAASTGGTKVCSKVARTDGGYGEWQQIALTNVTAGVSNYRTSLFFSAPQASLGVLPGDVLEMIVEYEIDAGYENLAGVFLRATENDGTGALPYEWRGNASAGTADQLPDLTGGLKGVIRGPTFEVRPDVGADSIQVHFGLQGIASAPGGVTATGRFVAKLQKVV